MLGCPLQPRPPPVSLGHPQGASRASPSGTLSLLFAAIHMLRCPSLLYVFWCHDAFLFSYSPLIKSIFVALSRTLLTVHGDSTLVSVALPWAVEKFPRNAHHLDPGRCPFPRSFSGAGDRGGGSLLPPPSLSVGGVRRGEPGAQLLPSTHGSCSWGSRAKPGTSGRRHGGQTPSGG